MKSILINIFALLCVAASLQSCKDDLFIDEPQPFPEGETTLEATISFRPFEAGLTDSRSAGDALKFINDLAVVVFDSEGNFIKCQDITESTLETVPGNENETKVAKKEFNLTLPYGAYKIFAVGNIPYFTATYGDKIKSIADLQAIKLTWVAIDNKADGETERTEKTKKNAQMFGYFTDGNSLGNFDSLPDQAPVIRIDKSNMTLHGFMRRAASKLTIAYDASGLKNGVTIFIHSVQIKDIPQNCWLGKNNAPGKDDVLIHEGEMITYDNMSGTSETPTYTPDTDRHGIYLSNGPTVNSGGSVKHTEFDNALYFYENNQGEGPVKYQDKSGNNSSVSYPESTNPNHKYYKDAMPYGTYVEVKGYYVSDIPGNPGNGLSASDNDSKKVGHGDIVYRFMLGKDIHKDYNAERNYHYKLTMRFRGYANDVDWHIEYDEPDPGIYVKSPQYISYLYDRTMTLNVKVVGELVGPLQAEIVRNDWGPANDDANGTPPTEDVFYKGNVYEGTDALKHPGVQLGFLSLRKTKNAVIGKGEPEYGKTFLEDYWTTHSRGTRDYQTKVGEHPNDADGDYSVVKDIDGKNGSPTLTFNIPLYTRAKNMVTTSGYTGNNVYVAYQRRAKVRVYGTIKLPGTETTKEFQDFVDIRQVRRVVNPKGIWRKGSSTEEFNVHLLRLEGDAATKFSDFKSDGPWRAEIAAGDWFSITPTGNATQSNEETNKIVRGGDQTSITFKFQPNGALPGGDKGEPRCGVIRVYYHNYTCVHLIFVRQGYEPIALNNEAPTFDADDPNCQRHNQSDHRPSGIPPKWLSFNVYSMANATTYYNTPSPSYDVKYTSDPRDEGSYFKWFQADAILARNNRTGDKGSGFGYAVQPGELSILHLEHKNSGTPTQKEEIKNWSKISAQDMVATKGWKNHVWMLSDEKGTFKRWIASKKDYECIQFDPDQRPYMQNGFGILYADGATETQDVVEKANKYYGDINDQTRGMRGCFVYNNNDKDQKYYGRNIFFPIGAEGHGRRKAAYRTDPNGDRSTTSGELDENNGMLRYSNRYETYKGTELMYRPLFYDLYKRPGAVYWCGEVFNYKDGDGLNSAWDINYYTLNFDAFGPNALQRIIDSDACLIRAVEY